jgi:hypothetical protein
MSRVSEIEFAGQGVERSGNHGRQPQRAVRFFVGKGEGIVQRRQQSSGISNVLKFVQEIVDMPGNAAGSVAVANTISENNAGNIVATRKHGRKITAFVAAGRNGDDVTFQPRQLQGPMGALVACPQLHATERALARSCALELLGFNFLDSHDWFDVGKLNPGAAFVYPIMPIGTEIGA